MAGKKEEGWFRQRSYSHLDYPPSFEAAKKIVGNAPEIAKRQFLPFIGYVDEKRRYRTDNSDRTIPRKLRPTKVSVKKREIRYASHGDAAVYQYYASLIDGPYEAFLKASGLDDCVIGYRSGQGSNIDMAAEAFSEISGRANVAALCFDIENFFPSIRHVDLKTGLLNLLGGSSLSDDWYQVYFSLVRYAWIEIEELAQIEGFDPKSPPFPLVKNINSALDRCRAGKIMHKHRDLFGIPQGTPFSAIAANIAMMSLDIEILNYVNSIGGFYRRYSDDILVLVDPADEKVTEKMIADVAKSHGLNISKDKTEISRFSVQSGKQVADMPISYLGFCFDGQRAFLRSSTLSRYYRRMTYATRGAVRGAGKKGKPASETFMRELYKDFTHLGRRNFYSYSKRAHSSLPGSIIKKQMRRHFKILLRKLLSKGR